MRGLAAGVVAAALLLPAAPALGDADPPSDVLLVQDVYYPYFPAPSRPAVAQLDALVATARRRGFPLKVALIATRADLGSVPGMFQQPDRYVKFLDQEISFNRTEPLLVVMAGAYAVAGLPAKAAQAVRDLPATGTSGDELAGGAVLAIPKLAAATGHDVPAPKPVAAARAKAHKSGGPPTALFLALPVLLLALVGGFTAVRSRRLRGNA
jgi:hypothetical protein